VATEIKTVTIEVALPHPCLSPNARAHWAQVSRQKKILRECVANTIRFTRPELIDARWPAARIQYTFYHAVNRGRDDDNYRAMMKAARDAFEPEKINKLGTVIPGCGLVENDNDIRDDMPVRFRKCDRERVEITLHKIGADR